MDAVMLEEKTYSPMSGYLVLLIDIVILALILLISLKVIQPGIFWIIPLGLIFLFTVVGFNIVNPNESTVLVLFGNYKGTIKKNGFFWVLPFFIRTKISLRARNIDSDPIKVNDKLGNPIMIGVVLVWRVEDTFKAAFEVDHYEHFVEIQSEAAVRKLGGHYAYDTFEDDETIEITLRSGGEEVNHVLEAELTERLAMAGIKVIEARISYLAYASEIASAMLQRQQATAIVAARTKIVEGAVSMVEMALDQLSRKNIIELDEEKKAAMISNLMVVLCSDKAASPIVNAGTLHH
jgi:regulator of protease activity HflC (stomatin/prohibitin superfamily)